MTRITRNLLNVCIAFMKKNNLMRNCLINFQKEKLKYIEMLQRLSYCVK